MLGATVVLWVQPPLIGEPTTTTVKPTSNAAAVGKVANALNGVAAANAGVLVGAPNLNLPTSGLYTRHTGADQPYLISTNGAFGQGSPSSLQLLTTPGTDAVKVGKLLGDGFYEGQLVANQITELTGRKFLNGYGSAMSQYQGLLDSGKQYAQQFNLQIGVALTSEQMAQLTSDMVWLVSEVVNGQTVLVRRCTLPPRKPRT